MSSRNVIRALIGQAADAASLDVVYRTALRCVREGLDVERASLLVLDSSRTMRFVAWSDLSSGYRSVVDGHSPWAPDDPAATPWLVPDVERESSLAAYLPVLRREGIGALAGIPLQFGRKLLGKFMLYYPATHAFSEAEVATAQQVADHVAFALEHHRIASALDARLFAERELRRHAESEAARRHASENRLHLALAAGRMGTWEWDIASRRVLRHVSRLTSGPRLFGVPASRGRRANAGPLGSRAQDRGAIRSRVSTSSGGRYISLASGSGTAQARYQQHDHALVRIRCRRGRTAASRSGVARIRPSQGRVSGAARARAAESTRADSPCPRRAGQGWW